MQLQSTDIIEINTTDFLFLKRFLRLKPYKVILVNHDLFPNQRKGIPNEYFSTIYLKDSTYLGPLEELLQLTLQPVMDEGFPTYWCVCSARKTHSLLSLLLNIPQQDL